MNESNCTASRAENVVRNNLEIITMEIIMPTFMILCILSNIFILIVNFLTDRFEEHDSWIERSTQLDLFIVAISDLSFATLGLIGIYGTRHFDRDFHRASFGQYVYTVVVPMIYLAENFVLWMLTKISIERFLFLYYPSLRLITTRSVQLSRIIVVFIVIAFGILPALKVEKKLVCVETTRSGDIKWYRLAKTAFWSALGLWVLFWHFFAKILPVILTIGFNIPVVKTRNRIEKFKLRGSFVINSDADGGRLTQLSKKGEINFHIAIFLITAGMACFFLTCFPSIIREFIDDTVDYAEMSAEIEDAVNSVVVFRCVVLSLLYYIIPAFRYTVWTKICCRKPRAMTTRMSRNMSWGHGQMGRESIPFVTESRTNMSYMSCVSSLSDFDSTKRDTVQK